MEPTSDLEGCLTECHLLNIPIEGWQLQMTAVRPWQLCLSTHRTGHWNRSKRKWGCGGTVWHCLTELL